METEYINEEIETKQKNFHYFRATNLEQAYLLLHKSPITQEVRESLKKGEAAILYDVDGVLTDWKIRDVILLSLYQRHLSTMKSIIFTFAKAAHIVYTSRPQLTEKIRDWITPLKKTLSSLPRSRPQLVEVISFTADNIQGAKTQLRSVLQRKEKENVLAIVTDLAKEVSLKIISRLLGKRTNDSRDHDMVIPLFETVGEEYGTLVILDNDDTIFKQVQQFAKDHENIEIYYISITTKSYVTWINNKIHREKGES